MRPYTRVIGATAVVLLVALSLMAAPKNAIVVIKGPTVVAFFPPVSATELKADPDTNEALSDFQVYAARVRKPLNDEGVAFKELYAKSFRVQQGKRIATFRPGKVEIGYYFAAPGKKPRIEYGVLTDDDIIKIAKGYFDQASRPAVVTSGK
jgi:hypothetical protein